MQRYKKLVPRKLHKILKLGRGTASSNSSEGVKVGTKPLALGVSLRRGFLTTLFGTSDIMFFPQTYTQIDQSVGFYKSQM